MKMLINAKFEPLYVLFFDRTEIIAVKVLTLFVPMYPNAYYIAIFINVLFPSYPLWIVIAITENSSLYYTLTATIVAIECDFLHIKQFLSYFVHEAHGALCAGPPLNRNKSVPEVKLRRRGGSRAEQPIPNSADQWDHPIALSVTGAIDVEDASN